LFSVQLESPVLIAAIFISGIGGTFQFGFHISVLTSPSSVSTLVNTTCLHRYSISLEQWEVTLIWSFIVSIFCIGGLLGSLCAGRLSSAYGRKRCLLLNNLFAIGGAGMMLLSKTSMSFEMIMVGRFLYGINAGVGLSVHTMYLVECAPKRLQGIVGVSVATFLSMGKFSGQLLGISELLGTEDRWPWLLGFSGATALLQLITLPLLPESPKYLLLDRGDRQGCEKAILRLWGNRDHSAEVEKMLVEHASMNGVRSHTVLDLILDQTIRWQLLTILVVFTTLQFSGINAVSCMKLVHEDIVFGSDVTHTLTVYSYTQENLDYFCFLIFFVFCFLSGLFVWYNVPETKNRTVMEITPHFALMTALHTFGILSTSFMRQSPGFDFN
uniref:Solute carrier family 2 member 11, like n=1 Tax=Hucho hucho TaxID=62062 RepID=A0A4W5P9C7_9TELE